MLLLYTFPTKFYSPFLSTVSDDHCIGLWPPITTGHRYSPPISRKHYLHPPTSPLPSSPSSALQTPKIISHTNPSMESNNNTYRNSTIEPNHHTAEKPNLTHAWPSPSLSICISRIDSHLRICIY